MSWMSDFFARVSGAKQTAAVGDAARLAEVEAVLDDLRPAIAADGGAVQLVSVDEAGWITVRLEGACTSCYAVDTTLQQALEPKLRERLRWFAGLRSE